MNLSPSTAGRHGRDPFPTGVWRVMRDQFIRGKIGIHALAQRHVLPVRVVQDRAEREHWHELRTAWLRENKLPPWSLSYEELEKAVLPLTADLVHEHHDGYLRALTNLEWLRQEAMADAQQGPATSRWSPHEWKAFAGAYAILLECTRIMLGIPEPLSVRTKTRPSPNPEPGQHPHFPSTNQPTA